MTNEEKHQTRKVFVQAWDVSGHPVYTFGESDVHEPKPERRGAAR